METSIKELYISNFKSYADETRIPLEDLSVLIGANSSGKSTALQVILIIKQTLECNTPDVDLLLSGKYVSVGDFDEAINNNNSDFFSIGLSYKTDTNDEDISIRWVFNKNIEKYESVQLNSVEIQRNSESYSLKRVGDDRFYRIFHNDIPSVYQYIINNLRITDLYITYDDVLNSLFRDYLKELTDILFDKKKRADEPLDDFVSRNSILDFGFYLMREDGELPHYPVDRDNSPAENELSMAAVELIKRFVRTQYRENENNIGFPERILVDLIFNIIKKSGRVDELRILIDDYVKKLEGYNKEEHLVEKFVKKSRYDIDEQQIEGALKQFESVGTTVLENIPIYNSIMRKLAEHIYYIGPIREKPQGLYNFGFESTPKYVGITGAYFASVLLHEKQKRNYIVPSGFDICTLEEALGDWLLYLRIASYAEVEERSSFGYSIRITDRYKKAADIMNVGIGTSQVLPVLIQGLVSDVDDILIFEQPELHLHPYSQSRLADFLVQLVKNRRKVFIETHSEYLILRLRYLIAKDDIKVDNIRINFFQKSNGTCVYSADLSELGNIVYPDDFKDTTEQLLMDLLDAQMGKRNHR